jgi:hydroxymethylpyrimidine pyrophosphatase-like HAD family hydrolase
MKKKIYFDMDGTIADLYGVQGWLEDLIAGETRPYAEAKPLVNMNRLARRLNLLQKAGYEIGIITWLSKNGTEAYNKAVAEVKRAWLKKHLATVEWNEIHIVAYGVPKETIGKGILFDDEFPNREKWGEGAYEPKDIFEILGGLN